VVKLFVKAIGSIEGAYLCVDPVDEVPPQHRSQFLHANVRLFLTGRSYIREEPDKHLTKGAYTIHIVADKGDITRYLSRMIDDEDDGQSEK